MKFENPEVRHDVNVTPARPGRDFLAITASILGVAAILATGLYFAAGMVAKQLPFSIETRFAAGLITDEADKTGRQDALRGLAARLAREMALPGEVSLRVHYRDEPTVNAIATLGGNIVVYRGLLERMPHENALAMVIAHEIAHIRHRDPAIGAGRGLALAVVFGALSAGAGDAIGGKMAGGVAQLTALKFNRDQEAAADAAGLAAVAALYGHVNGAADVFKMFAAEREKNAGGEPPRFLASHPLTRERIERIAQLARERGWSNEGATTPLAGALAAFERK